MGRFTAKKGPKPKAASKKKKEPETFDEFMEGNCVKCQRSIVKNSIIDAIQFEEQGDRYKDGERAERNYERAADMYGKAFSLNSQDADCVYNWLEKKNACNT